jgi:hypothetical protein
VRVPWANSRCALLRTNKPKSKYQTGTRETESNVPKRCSTHREAQSFQEICIGICCRCRLSLLLLVWYKLPILSAEGADVEVVSLERRLLLSWAKAGDDLEESAARSSPWRERTWSLCLQFVADFFFFAAKIAPRDVFLRSSYL